MCLLELRDIALSMRVGVLEDKIIVDFCCTLKTKAKKPLSFYIFNGVSMELFPIELNLDLPVLKAFLSNCSSKDEKVISLAKKSKFFKT